MIKFRAKKILVPVDFSAFSEGALETAADLAQTQDGELTLLHVMMEPRASVPYKVYIDWQKVKDEIWRDVEKSLETMKEKNGFAGKAQHPLFWGDPPGAIVKYANENGFDLIVMATHGRTGVGRLFMGSVAENVICHSPCPVVVLRSSELVAA